MEKFYPIKRGSLRSMVPGFKPILGILFLLLLSFNASAQYDKVVAKDGSGDYLTVQAAVDAAPTGLTSPYRIFIKSGTYVEAVTVPSNKPFLQLIGEDVVSTIITYNNANGKTMPGGGTFGTGNSATVIVNATDFSAANITFQNTTGDAPQALAINVNNDRASFKNCRFLGGQDTLLANNNGMRQYYLNCYIDGVVDFIFGNARAVFDYCVIYPKDRVDKLAGSYITAANTKSPEPYGFVFRNCNIIPNTGVTKYVLGRPWQNDAATAAASKSLNKTVFLNTTMSSVVNPVGWSTWDSGTDVSLITYAEYKSVNPDGSPLDVSQRVSWSKQLTDAEAAEYNNTNLFAGWDPTGMFTDGAATSDLLVVSNFKGTKSGSSTIFNWNLSWPEAGVTYNVYRSTDNGANYSVVNTQTISSDNVNVNYTEAVPPPGQTYSYYVIASKSGFSSSKSDVFSVSSIPTISVSGSFGSFLQGMGTPSNSQLYTVSGVNLSEDLVITAPAGYQLSSNNGTTWFDSSSPIHLTPVSGIVDSKTIAVRLNSTTAGTFNGNLVHSSTGATSVNLALSGTVQSTPLLTSNTIVKWPLTANSTDETASRASGVEATTPTFTGFVISDGTGIAPYSEASGQAFAVSATGGSWQTASGGPGTLNRNFYEEFSVKADATHTLRVDSLIFATSVTQTTGHFAVSYSLNNFTSWTDVTAGKGPDGLSLSFVSNGAFTNSAIVLAKEDLLTSNTYRLAIGSGVSVPANQTLKIRIYYRTGSSSAGRFAKIKNLYVKGASDLDPVAGDYRTHQSGEWSDLSTWERFDGTSWVTPAPAYPVYDNAGLTTIMGGHSISVSATLANGFGYIARTTIKESGSLYIAPAATLNIANDGSPATTTTDLKVDGELNNSGNLYTNGTCAIVINGTLRHLGTNLKFSNTADDVTINGTLVNSGTNLTLGTAAVLPKVTAKGVYQQNINSSVVPDAIWDPAATLNITGLTTSQTGIFKTTITYGNIIWDNNQASGKYYAIRGNLNSTNVKGKFTLKNTGSSYVSFFNAAGIVNFPGGFEQTGGEVQIRENGTVNAEFNSGGDFIVSGGTFKSNTSDVNNSVTIRLSGTGKKLQYSQATATYTNWIVDGSYTLASNLSLPTSGKGLTVNGSLDAGTNVISGAGTFSLANGGTLLSGSATGLDGNLTVSGTKTFDTGSNLTFNGLAAESTGVLPSTFNTLTINNASNVSLGNSVIANNLVLTAGKLLLGANSVSVSSVSGSSSDKFVVTDGAGTLKVRNVGAVSTLFPVGVSTTSYSPVTLNNSGTADDFSVRVQNTFDNAPADANKVVNKQWTIAEAVDGGSNLAVSLGWTVADQAAGFSPASVSIIRHNGTTWVETPASTSGAGTLINPYTASAANFTGLGTFGIQNPSALPLSIITVKAKVTEGFSRAVNVTWVTANEANTRNFSVERSIDGKSFVGIASLLAKGSGANTYAFTDANPLEGTSYYRIRQVDADGKSFATNPVAVENAPIISLSVYPNPGTANITVSHPVANNGALIKLFSLSGQQVLSVPVSKGSVLTTGVDVTKLNSGYYVIQYDNGSSKSSTTFVKH